MPFAPAAVASPCLSTFPYPDFRCLSPLTARLPTGAAKLYSFRKEESFPFSLSAKAAVPAARAKAARSEDAPASEDQSNTGRRTALTLVLGAAAASIVAGELGPLCSEALAVSSSRRALRESRIPESEYKTLPNGLKIYDIKVGSGQEAVKGARVVVHYVVKWKGITFMTSRQGLGVTGGTPYGFDVGSSSLGMVLKGLDLGVEGMRVGGERLLIVPPELGYGNKGIQEIPPGATLDVNIELISIKQNVFGSRVKLIEG